MRPVPFVGWSRAAMNFRRHAAEFANRGVSVLIAGAAGAGKRTAARAWREASGAGEQDLPIVNLDTVAEVPDPCIGITSGPLPGNLHCLHLDTYRHAAAPADGDGTPNRALAARAVRFAVRLYLRRWRPGRSTSLAILDFYNCRVLPRRYATGYHRVSTALVSGLLHVAFPGDSAGLAAHLRAAAARDLTPPRDGTATGPCLRLDKGLSYCRPGMH